jgi:hypothetical protein
MLAAFDDSCVQLKYQCRFQVVFDSMLISISSSSRFQFGFRLHLDFSFDFVSIQIAILCYYVVIIMFSYVIIFKISTSGISHDQRAVL